jgi:hypothetical protein
VPVLLLGEIGSAYGIVPERLSVNLAEAPPRLSEPRLLVAGRTLGNCPSWKEKLDASLGSSVPFEGLCRTMGPDPASLRRIRADEALANVGLFINNRAPTATKKPDNTVLIVVVAVVVVLVVGAIGAVALFLTKRRDAEGSSASQDSISA